MPMELLMGLLGLIGLIGLLGMMGLMTFGADEAVRLLGLTDGAA